MNTRNSIQIGFFVFCVMQSAVGLGQVTVCTYQDRGIGAECGPAMDVPSFSEYNAFRTRIDALTKKSVEDAANGFNLKNDEIKNLRADVKKLTQNIDALTKRLTTLEKSIDEAKVRSSNMTRPPYRVSVPKKASDDRRRLKKKDSLRSHGDIGDQNTSTTMLARLNRPKGTTLAVTRQARPKRESAPIGVFGIQ
jgi:hypothetical protein